MKFARIVVWYMVKYLAGFLLVFGCSVMVFAVAKKSIEGYVTKQVEMKTEEGIQKVEETIKKVDLINRMLYQNKDFVSLQYRKDALPKEDLLKLKNCNDLLGQSAVVVDGVPYIFVLFKNNDLYLSSSQCSLSFSDYYTEFLTIDFGKGTEADASFLKADLFDRKKEGSNFRSISKICYVADNKQEQEKGLLYLSQGSDRKLSTLHVFCAVIPEAYLTESRFFIH